MFEVGNKCKRNGHGLHFVIICDEAGIFDAFNLLGSAGWQGKCILSLIYSVSDKNLHPLFEQELIILEKIFCRPDCTYFKIDTKNIASNRN
jgi:hypothetical protein